MSTRPSSREPPDEIAVQRKVAMPQNSLENRIAEYQPLAIVSLLLSIEHIVEAAAIAAGSRVPRFGVPFPGSGFRRPH
jgi:hypothetical protein